MTVTETVLAAVAAIFMNFDPSAAEKLLAPDYIQHNVAVPTGAAPILEFIPALEESGIKLTTHRVISEGEQHRCPTESKGQSRHGSVPFAISEPL